MWSNSNIPAFYPDLTRVLRAETRNELRLRERLVHDEIAALMRRLDCRECGQPVTECTCEKPKPQESWI